MTLQKLNSPAAQETLAQITHVYTDLDGTLLAPGGRLLTGHNGKPSTLLAKVLVKMKQAGINVIIVTGRDAASATEIMRLLNLEQFIAEMGCITQFSYGAYAEKQYNLGDWTAEHFNEATAETTGSTPHDLIAQSGALEDLLSHFSGRLEVHALKGSSREVTYMLRGDVDTSPGGMVERLLAQHEPPLQLLDNGIIHPRDHGLLHVRDVHVYHLMPRGTGKGNAVAIDMATKGLSAAETVAIGDAEGDADMGRYTGSFVLMSNHKKAAPTTYVEATVANPDALFTTTLPTADGWTEFAHALLKAHCRTV